MKTIISLHHFSYNWEVFSILPDIDQLDGGKNVLQGTVKLAENWRFGVFKGQKNYLLKLNHYIEALPREQKVTNTTNFHSGSSKSSKCRLSTRARCLGLVSTSCTEFYMQSSYTELLKKWFKVKHHVIDIIKKTNIERLNTREHLQGFH